MTSQLAMLLRRCAMGLKICTDLTDVYVDTWAEPGVGDMHRPISNLKEMTPAYDAPCHKSYQCDAVSCPTAAPTPINARS